jgi:Protein of unknown function (DUF3060)
MRKSFLAVLTGLLAFNLAACNRTPNQVTAAASDTSPATPAAGQDSQASSLQIRVSSTQRTYACHNPGDSIQVTGSSDLLTITGSCGSLQVTGNSNSITIDSVQSVQFTGDSNSVLYRSAHRPTVNDDGRSNSIGHATGQVTTAAGNTVSSADDVAGSVSAAVASAMQSATAAGQSAASVAGAVQGVQDRNGVLNIILSKQRTTQDCGDGKVVNINGYENDITLTGSCSKVTLNGWGNTVRIEEVAAIEVMGHTNTFTWERGRKIAKPSVQIDSGMDNFVRHVTAH